MQPLLQVEDLRTWFHTDEGTAKAVDGVSFGLAEQETLGIVGESGCGKSVTALSILRLIPNPPGRVEGGSVRFQGRDLLALSEKEMRRIRGNEIAMIFQEPMTSLNPVYTIGEQISEVLRLHRGLSRGGAEERAVEMLRRVRIPDPEQRVEEYPHQLSGGQRQRVMIAMALACDPALLIADEPTTALDVTVQAQILELIAELRRQSNMALILITHDMGVIAGLCDRVMVMYAGRVVEAAPVRELFHDPQHPYTAGLLRSMPRLDEVMHDRLTTISGQPPNLQRLPAGCAFRTRCDRRIEVCAAEVPPLRAIAEERSKACHLSHL